MENDTEKKPPDNEYQDSETKLNSIDPNDIESIIQFIEDFLAERGIIKNMG
jgi:hypothetical protein